MEYIINLNVYAFLGRWAHGDGGRRTSDPMNRAACTVGVSVCVCVGRTFQPKGLTKAREHIAQSRKVFLISCVTHTKGALDLK